MTGKKHQNNKKSFKDRPEQPITNDPRFAHVHNDPRFARPKKKQFKVKVDDRFKEMLESEEFGEDLKVDRYGRRVEQKSAKEELKRFYDIDSEEEEEEEDEEENKTVEELEKELAEDEENLRDEVSEDELAAPKRAKKEVYDPMRGKGVIDSSDESTDEDEEDEADDESEEEDEIPTGEATRRLAAVNMDWDKIKAVDILKVMNGFAPPSSVIKSVTIYPSEFGKERMAREDIEGPPKEIFPVDVDENKPLADEGEEFDQDALRKYQIERLRYYYAVIECDTVETAKTIYKACDGTEYESSSNFFDLRYIPDDMTFDDEPKDVATFAPDDYKPTRFVTEALQQTKVKLTWDEDDADRMNVTRRNFTEEDLENINFDAYIASSDDGDEEEKDDLETLREKYRRLLENEDGDDFGDGEEKAEGDMEITFTPGLSEAAGSAVHKKWNDEEEEMEETTIEKYMRKQREKRRAKKERKKAEKEAEALASDEDKSGKKKKKNKKLSKEEREQEDKEKAELELLMGDSNSKGDGFDMRDVLKREKAEAKKGKKNKKKAAALEGAQDDFEIDVNDPRFAALHESHHFAIDPTNPQFKNTKSMKKILAARRERMQNMAVDEEEWTKEPEKKKRRKD